ncbi:MULTISPECIES: GtrA family protein [Acinetobacter]|uniref:GtrA family protein n=1 Tax=Acinetobacter TaxID=469 RepID=UPI0015D1376E|nr:GtrA family protein [Acinetobacter sp. YH01012]
MNPLFNVALLYTLFAVAATFCNILAQEISIQLLPSSFSLFISIFIGTLVGLVVKYILDKKYIFKYKTANAKHNRQTFILYAVMGIFTTVIFWGFEFGFHYLFETKEMRYIGGILGLMIGYVSKYYLDKKFVFTATQG